MKIAALLTCYNRVNTTLRCLQQLQMQRMPSDCQMDVYLVDDASPDQTGERVRQWWGAAHRSRGAIANVHVIYGSGKLFWCGGMKRAWEVASQERDYDYYLWMNDDAVLFENAISQMLEDSGFAGGDSILIGAFVDPGTGTLFYGASDIKVLQGRQPVESFGLMNGNLVLIPRVVYKRIGGMSSAFTHQYGDHEYGFRARRAGFKTYVSRSPVGENRANYGMDKVKFAQNNVVWRIRHVNDPKWYGLMDYCRYKYIVYGFCPAVMSFCKGVLVVLFPRFFMLAGHQR